MLWATERLVHFDRAASAWLICRFIDPDAVFAFVERGADPPMGATMFSGSQGDMSRHDADGSTFSKIRRKFDVADPLLEKMERVIDAGIAYVMKGDCPRPGDPFAALAPGLLAIAEGTLALEDDDKAVLDRAFPVWDALYVQFGLMAARCASAEAADIPEALRSTRFAMSVSGPRQRIIQARRRRARARA